MPKKIRTRDQVAAMKEKAVRFLRDVVCDRDIAQQFAEMSTDDYAEHKHIQIQNASPRTRSHAKGLNHMPTRRTSRTKLEKRIEELESENEALAEKLENIVDIASENDSDEDEDDDDG